MPRVRRGIAFSPRRTPRGPNPTPSLRGLGALVKATVAPSSRATRLLLLPVALYGLIHDKARHLINRTVLPLGRELPQLLHIFGTGLASFGERNEHTEGNPDGVNGLLHV